MTKFGLVRVSSEEQANFGKSIQAQKEKLLNVGVPEENIYIDGGVSGGVKEDMEISYFEDNKFHTIIDLRARKEFCQLITLMQSGDEIYFTKFDRLTRSSHFQDIFINHCKRKKITLIPLDDTTHRLTRRILAVINEEEIEVTKTRNNSIHQSYYEKGLYPYKSPYGYERTEKGTLEINAEQANIVKECFQIAIQSKQTHNSTLYLQFCKKHHIDPSTYYRIIKNKTYLGMTHLQDKWKHTPHVPIIIISQIWEALYNEKI